MESGRIQDWANHSQSGVGRKYDWADSTLYTVYDALDHSATTRPADGDFCLKV